LVEVQTTVLTTVTRNQSTHAPLLSSALAQTCFRGAHYGPNETLLKCSSEEAQQGPIFREVEIHHFNNRYHRRSWSRLLLCVFEYGVPHYLHSVEHWSPSSLQDCVEDAKHIVRNNFSPERRCSKSNNFQHDHAAHLSSSLIYRTAPQCYSEAVQSCHHD
jgi:hypothetical protein